MGKDNNVSERQGFILSSDMSVEKERFNEYKYRGLFTDLLKRHRNLITVAQEGDHPEHYAAERELLRTAVSSELNAILCGVAIGAAAFISLRYLPAHLVRWIGGEKKARALREAEEAAKKDKYRLIRTATGLLVEGTFGIWAGWRGYQIMSARTEGTYEAISKIPLCQGRSALSDGLCSEWVDLTHRRIPPTFWQNLDNDQGGGLNDPRTWRAIRNFAENCIKRDAYEKKIREESGMNPDEPVIISSPGVPDDVLPLPVDEFLSKERAEELVTEA